MSLSTSNGPNECWTKKKILKLKFVKKSNSFIPVCWINKMTFLLLALVFAGNVTKTKQSNNSIVFQVRLGWLEVGVSQTGRAGAGMCHFCTVSQQGKLANSVNM